MAWIEKLRRDAEFYARHGMFADEVELMEPLVCDDGMARLAGASIRDQIGISSRMRRRLDKRVGRIMRQLAWEPRLLWLDGEPKRAWAKPVKPGGKLRRPGRPAGSKDAKPRQRRWHKRPEGATTWREERKRRGLP
jgi:hypothetical protein